MSIESAQQRGGVRNGTTPSKSPPRLLAVTYGGGHIAMVIPVLEALRKLVPDLQIELLALTTARATAARMGYSSTGYADLLEQWPDPQATVHGQRLLAGNTHPEVETAESIAYLGLNWLDLVAQHGGEKAQQLYESQGRTSFYPLQLMLRLLKDRKPDFLLTTSSPRTEAAALEAAVALGVPSMAMFDLFPIVNDPFALRRAQADITTVLSEAGRDTLIRAGMAASRVVVTGNPAFDGLSAQEPADEGARMVNELGWQGKWIILYAGHAEAAAGGRWAAGTQFPLAIERELRSYVDKHSDVAVVIRQHPNNCHLFEDAWALEAPHPRVHISLPSTERVEPWILSSNVVVVHASTVGLQAAIAGKPVLGMDESPSIALASFSWPMHGIAQGVPRVEELTHYLNHARHQPQKAVTQFPTPAAPNIAQLIADRLLAI